MRPLSIADEPVFVGDLPCLETGIAYLVSGDVSDQSVEKQYLGTGVEVSARCERYPAAWRAKHKLMQVMAEREAERSLQGKVFMDDAYLGGERRGKAGRGSDNKILFATGVQLSAQGHPQIVYFDPITGFTKETIGHWSEHYLGASTWVLSDGLNCFPGVEQAEAAPVPEVVGAGRRSTDMPCFTWINTVLCNVKTSLAGTYHSFHFRKYAHRYLPECQYRFNRRFDLKAILPRLVRAAATTGPRMETWLRLAEHSC